MGLVSVERHGGVFFVAFSLFFPFFGSIVRLGTGLRSGGWWDGELVDSFCLWFLILILIFFLLRGGMLGLDSLIMRLGFSRHRQI